MSQENHGRGRGPTRHRREDNSEGAGRAKKSPRSGRRGAFWAVAYSLTIVLLGANLPTPLYEVYRREMGFGDWVLTLVFAAYVAALLLTLIAVGRVSHRWVGRRMLLAALAAALTSAALFAAAQNVPMLLTARALQGVAAGVLTAVATATLTEFEPASDDRRAALVASAATAGGLALGPLVGGLLAEYAPRPVAAVYASYVALLVPALLGALAIPKAGTWERDGAGPPRGFGVPASVRRLFVVTSAAFFAGWVPTALFLALGPSLLYALSGESNRALGGAVVFAVFAASACGQVLLRRASDRPSVAFGLALMIVGLAAVALALPLRSVPVFLAGAVCLGLGQGLSFKGSLALLNRASSPEHRARTTSSYFVIGYLGVALLLPAAGFASERLGLFTAAVALASVMAALASIALVAALRGFGAAELDRREG